MHRGVPQIELLPSRSASRRHGPNPLPARARGQNNQFCQDNQAHGGATTQNQNQNENQNQVSMTPPTVLTVPSINPTPEPQP